MKEKSEDLFLFERMGEGTTFYQGDNKEGRLLLRDDIIHYVVSKSGYAGATMVTLETQGGRQVLLSLLLNEVAGTLGQGKIYTVPSFFPEEPNKSVRPADIPA